MVMFFEERSSIEVISRRTWWEITSSGMTSSGAFDLDCDLLVAQPFEHFDNRLLDLKAGGDHEPAVVGVNRFGNDHALYHFIDRVKNHTLCLNGAAMNGNIEENKPMPTDSIPLKPG